MHTNFYFSFELYFQRFFSELTEGMERLEEYADEESPFTERSNSKREPIQEEITNNSSELLQIVKELRTETKTVKKKWENSESSGGAKSDFNGKISDRGNR